MSNTNGCKCPGFTYIELMIALAMASAIILGLTGVVGQTLHTSSTIHAKNNITRDAQFALSQMTQAILKSHHLLLPLNDNPNTNWPENIRQQTDPATAPVGDSTLATAVLAVTLPHHIDQDKNGIADADNDADGLFDEDLGADNNADGAAGIFQIDDNGDGGIDNSTHTDDDQDNDEDNAVQEDSSNGLDDDADGSIDEDQSADLNEDDCPGVCGVDDDKDGSIDTGSIYDDDEDGQDNEDWYDPVVFYLADNFDSTGKQLIKRTPVPWDSNEDSVIDGADFITSVIADNVTNFRVERLAESTHSIQQIDITLQVTSPESGESISLNTIVRLGGGL